MTERTAVASALVAALLAAVLGCPATEDPARGTEHAAPAAGPAAAPDAPAAAAAAKPSPPAPPLARAPSLAAEAGGEPSREVVEARRRAAQAESRARLSEMREREAREGMAHAQASRRDLERELELLAREREHLEEEQKRDEHRAKEYEQLAMRLEVEARQSAQVAARAEAASRSVQLSLDAAPVPREEIPPALVEAREVAGDRSAPPAAAAAPPEVAREDAAPAAPAPVAAPAPAVEPAAPPAPALTWNAWWEAEKRKLPAHRPLPFLKPSSPVTLVVDLALRAYAEKDVAGKPVSEDVRKRIEERTRELDLADRMPLRALVLFDPLFFKLADGRVRDLDVNLVPLKHGVWPTADPNPENPLAAKAHVASLGAVLFPLQTRERTGRTTVAISIWADDAPVDELYAEVCVGDRDACPDAPRLSDDSPLALAGYDPANPAVTKPDAAIHLVELGASGTLFGVLRARDWPRDRFVTWEVDRTTAELTDYVRATIAPALNSALKLGDAELERQALAVQDVLFPPGKQGKAARKAFLEFVASKVGTPPAVPCPEAALAAGADAPSIFFRAVPYGQSAPLLFPMAFLGAELGSKVHFLGFHFRFELPLEAQSYRPQQGCIARWTLAFPPTDDGALSDAWTVMKREKLWVTLRERGFGSVTQLSDWMRDEDGAPESALLVLVSHHDHNQLWFSTSGERIVSRSIKRAFKEPSVAIVDGCGTGTSAATDLIQRLNERGINAAIATQTEVPGAMAGEFLNCLARSAAATGGDRPATLGAAYFDAVRCLSRKAPVDEPAYGARALTYALLGNGTIPICVPQE